jgi:hypothetical protein
VLRLAAVNYIHVTLTCHPFYLVTFRFQTFCLLHTEAINSDALMRRGTLKLRDIGNDLIMQPIRPESLRYWSVYVYAAPTCCHAIVLTSAESARDVPERFSPLEYYS